MSYDAPSRSQARLKARIRVRSSGDCCSRMENRTQTVSGENVATNISARRMRLLFVADDIPDPLERVVEFLNAEMTNIEALAVEIKQFRGEQTQTLVPRVLGRIPNSSPLGPTSRHRRLN